MRPDLERAAHSAAKAVRQMQGAVVNAAETTNINYEDIVLEQAGVLHRKLSAIEASWKLEPGTAIALALLRVGARV